MGKVKILFEIALRNLFASKINFVIGAVVFAGTVLVVVGSALLDSVDVSMAKSIKGSVAGDMQVYSAKSKDELALFGSMGGDPDLSPVQDFGKVYAVLSKVPNVKSIVPMGINNALVAGGNTVDQTLATLRNEIKAHGVTSEKSRSLQTHVRQMVELIATDRKKLDVLRQKTRDDVETDEAVATASAPAFWDGFDKDTDSKLEFLENHIAPAVSDADLMWISYIGTNLEDFAAAFDRVEIVDGTAVPKGHRGFLFNKLVYEDQVKLKSARRLDKIKDAKDSGIKITDDATLQRFVKENKAQTREISLQLDPMETKQAVAALQKGLASQTADLDGLLKELFDTNDDNFYPRYKLYYEGLVPLLELYRVKIGDTFTITAFTRSGFVQSVNVKVYGTFQFKGLEKAGLSGAFNMMDLVSFRQLYGHLSNDKLAEIAEIKKTGGAKEVSRDNAEAELFGGGNEVVANVEPGVIEEKERLDPGARAAQREAMTHQVYSHDEMNNGLAINAAVLLEDPAKLEQSMKDVEAAAKQNGLELKVMHWQAAAGFIGNMIMVSKVALYFAVFIVFVVLLVIINNAVMMATMQRVKEIGTLRAIGSQKSFVLNMIVTETVVLGLVFGGLGVVIGMVIMALLGHFGIPAGSEELYFFFSGPRLFPTVSAWNLLAAFLIVLFVSLVSTLYPAFLATRVSPLRAMQTDD
ncbi:MAG: FtsX-like permease family protein [Deltaproteobacteria bacterium]|nr:FtsX-like permease family protein [Deltaproteobacteria bacterium]